MESLTILNNLRIASPCPASWEAMRGDDRVRFCDACEKHVYNISGLTVDAAVALVRESEGPVCVRLYRRKDGTILTADCPVGLRAAVRRRLVRLAAAAVVMFATLRSGIWLFAQAGPRVSIPPPPTGPGVTVADLADWAAVALGIKQPSCNRVTLGRRVMVGTPAAPIGAAVDGGEETLEEPSQP
jgi:hypothetical protein